VFAKPETLNPAQPLGEAHARTAKTLNPQEQRLQTSVFQLSVDWLVVQRGSVDYHHWIEVPLMAAKKGIKCPILHTGTDGAQQAAPHNRSSRTAATASRKLLKMLRPLAARALENGAERRLADADG
jgi:hypothetical protein